MITSYLDKPLVRLFIPAYQYINNDKYANIWYTGTGKKKKDISMNDIDGNVLGIGDVILISKDEYGGLGKYRIIGETAAFWKLTNINGAVSPWDVTKIAKDSTRIYKIKE